jgi:4-alpha-glucanotransferase
LGFLSQKFLQYTFFIQWSKLKEYSNRKGIKIIGDIPIFVAYDSSDLWANKKYYF